jgi:hypothetical protein
MSLQELLKKATEGNLTSDELAQVVECLETGTCDPYGALLIVGRAGATQHRDMVEKYLTCSNRPMLARLSLLILCRYWGLSSEYKPPLEAFARGVEWDEEDDVRILAISIIGTLLATDPDDRFIRLLIDIFRGRTEPKSQMLRETAYCALGEASGKAPLDLPPASRHFDLEHDLDPDVTAYIEAAERRLNEPGGT